MDRQFVTSASNRGLIGAVNLLVNFALMHDDAARSLPAAYGNARMRGYRMGAMRKRT
jgi:hypothetical protein